MDKQHQILKNEGGQIAAIFFMQASSSIAFAVFYSGLSLYLTKNQLLSKETATFITAIFLSMNYLLPLVGGVIADRIITYKNLYLLGGVIAVISCLILAYSSYLYLGLASFLMISMVNKVCLNMFVTQLFSVDQIEKRRKAFIWNYVGSNLGFMLGFLLIGFCTLANHYVYLFITMSFFLALSILLSILFIKEQKTFTKSYKSTFYQFTMCFIVMVVTITIIAGLFYNARLAHTYITLLSVILFLGLIHYSFRHSTKEDRDNLIKFICFSILTIIFFTIYMLTPLAIMQIIEYNVQREIFGFLLAPQWLINIDSIVILVVVPSLTLLTRRENGNNIFTMKTLNYYSIGLTLVICGLLVLISGLSLLDASSKVPLFFMLFYLIFLTLAEIMISPIGDSLIGELIPESLRGLMTGTWSVNIAIGGLLSSIIANHFILPFVDRGPMTFQNTLKLQYTFIFISCILLVFIIVVLISSKSKLILINQNR